MSEVVRAFERGLRVLRSFDRARPQMTLAQVARAADLNRATARRLLLTLEAGGYVVRRGDQFRLTPRVLELGYAFLASYGVSDLAVPFLETLSEKVHESSSVAVLDAADVVYVARVPANRVMTVTIGIGSRFPAYRTSLGRVLLSGLSDGEVVDVWQRSNRRDPTPRTVDHVDALLRAVARVREQGFALVDQELELGVRSIAAPIRSRSGAIVAAMNVSTHVTRTTKSDLLATFVPSLLEAADGLTAALATRPTGAALT